MNLRQLQYLEAMDIALWVPRGQQLRAGPLEALPDEASAAIADVRPANQSLLALHFAPGQGSCLFVCAAAAEAATPLASDLARTVGGAPVWAWPDEAGGSGLEEVAGERLFTAVLIFGEYLARRLYGQSLPASCGPAPLLVAPALEAVASSATARRECWATIRAAGLHLGR